MSRGNGKNSSSMNTIWIVLGLAALGTGMGAAIATKLVNRTSSTEIATATNESALNPANHVASND